MGRLPICFSGYPAYCFGFQKAPDARVVASTLAEVLSTWRICAGRFRSDGRAIVLTDDGVPLLIRDAPEPASYEAALWSCPDFRSSWRSAVGCQPLMTVTLTRFPSGAGAVSICRSHGLADGATLAAFLADWNRVVAGKPLEPISNDRSLYDYHKPLEVALVELSEWAGRKVAVRRPLENVIRKVALPLFTEYELIRIARGKMLQTRPRVFFSHAELEELKQRASKGLTAVPWITTQEAFIAQLLRTLPAFFKRGPKVGLLLWLDGKRHMGEAGKRLASGTSMVSKDFRFDTAGKSLSALAEEVHQQLEAFSGEAVVEEVRMQQAIGKHSLNTPPGPPALWKLAGCDHKILLNNQSKLSMPDFGTGAAEWAMSTSGPTLMVPHKDGINVLFDGGTMPSKEGKVPEGLEEALRNFGD